LPAEINDLNDVLETHTRWGVGIVLMIHGVNFLDDKKDKN